MRVPSGEEIAQFYEDRRAKGLCPIHVCCHCGGYHGSAGCRNTDWTQPEARARESEAVLLAHVRLRAMEHAEEGPKE